jgi:DNA-binding NtrC family response regulator
MTLGTSILVVDDDEQIRKVLSAILGNEGYIVQTAKNGKKATDLTEKIHFDIALVDIGLPDLSGIELIQRLKFFQPRIITIMVTGSSDIDDAINAVNKGTDGYILKPVNPKKLLELIENLLKEKTANEIRDWINNKKPGEGQKDSLSHSDSTRDVYRTPW